MARGRLKAIGRSITLESLESEFCAVTLEEIKRSEHYLEQVMSPERMAQSERLLADDPKALMHLKTRVDIDQKYQPRLFERIRSAICNAHPNGSA